MMRFARGSGVRRRRGERTERPASSRFRTRMVVRANIAARADKTTAPKPPGARAQERHDASPSLARNVRHSDPIGFTPDILKPTRGEQRRDTPSIPRAEWRAPSSPHRSRSSSSTELHEFEKTASHRGTRRDSSDERSSAQRALVQDRSIAAPPDRSPSSEAISVTSLLGPGNSTSRILLAQLSRPHRMTEWSLRRKRPLGGARRTAGESPIVRVRIREVEHLEEFRADHSESPASTHFGRESPCVAGHLVGPHSRRLIAEVPDRRIHRSEVERPRRPRASRRARPRDRDGDDSPARGDRLSGSTRVSRPRWCSAAQRRTSATSERSSRTSDLSDQPESISRPRQVIEKLSDDWAPRRSVPKLSTVRTMTDLPSRWCHTRFARTRAVRKPGAVRRRPSTSARARKRPLCPARECQPSPLTADRTRKKTSRDELSWLVKAAGDQADVLVPWLHRRLRGIIARGGIAAWLRDRGAETVDERLSVAATRSAFVSGRPLVGSLRRRSPRSPSPRSTFEQRRHRASRATSSAAFALLRARLALSFGRSRQYASYARVEPRHHPDPRADETLHDDAAAPA